MADIRRVARGSGLVLAGIVSLIGGLVLAERLVRPDIIGLVTTPILFGVVLLFVLPALTFFALRHDARERVRLRLSAPRVTGDEAAPDPRSIRHDAHDRPAAPGRRHNDRPRPVSAE
jgi:hypothetical protein